MLVASAGRRVVLVPGGLRTARKGARVAVRFYGKHVRLGVSSGPWCKVFKSVLSWASHPSLS